jgi:hypothetical protein
MRILFASILTALVLAFAPAAHADNSPGVVTRHEIAQVQVGQTRHHITKAFGTPGTPYRLNMGVSPNGTTYRLFVSYPIVNGGNVSIRFVRKPGQARYHVEQLTAIAVVV